MLGFAGAALVSSFVGPLSATLSAIPRVPPRVRAAAGSWRRPVRQDGERRGQAILSTSRAPVTVDVIVLAVLLAVAGGLIAGIVRRLAGRAAAACRRPRANPVTGATHPVARAAPPGTLSQPTGRTSMYQLIGVTKTYKKGQDTVEALRGVDLTDRGPRMAGHPGADRVTARPRCCRYRRPRPAPPPAARCSTARTLQRYPGARSPSVRATSIGFIFQTFNLIPTLSAAGERGGGAGAAGSVQARHAAGLGGAGRSMSASATGCGTCRRVVRWPAAARRHRPCPGQEAHGAARRRTDRQPRRRHPRRDHRAAREALEGPRADA